MAPYSPYSAMMVDLPHVFSVLRHLARLFWNHTCVYTVTTTLYYFITTNSMGEVTGSLMQIIPPVSVLWSTADHIVRVCRRQGIGITFPTTSQMKPQQRSTIFFAYSAVRLSCYILQYCRVAAVVILTVSDYRSTPGRPVIDKFFIIILATYAMSTT